MTHTPGARRQGDGAMKVLELSTGPQAEATPTGASSWWVGGREAGCKSHSCSRLLQTKTVKKKASSGSLKGQKWAQPVGSIVLKAGCQAVCPRRGHPGLWKCQELVCTLSWRHLCVGTKRMLMLSLFGVGGWGVGGLAMMCSCLVSK